MYGNPTALQYYRKLNLKTFEVYCRGVPFSEAGFTFPVVARTHGTYEVRGLKAECSIIVSNPMRQMARKASPKISLAEQTSKRHVLTQLRLAASLLSGVPQMRVTDNAKDLAGSPPLSVSMAKTAQLKGKNRKRGRASGNQQVRPAIIPDLQQPERTQKLLYSKSSIVFVKVVGGTLAIARLQQHMYTVKGPVRGKEGDHEWVEPAVVEVTYFEQNYRDMRLGYTTMTPEGRNNRVDRGSIYGVVQCEREDSAIFIHQAQMVRMQGVIDTPIEPELSLGEPWSAAAEAGSQRSQAPGANTLYDEIRAGNWANAGTMAHLEQTKREAWSSRELASRPVERNECWEQCRLAYEARTVGLGRSQRTRAPSQLAVEAAANSSSRQMQNSKRQKR